jgi:hypothetical protein
MLTFLGGIYAAASESKAEGPKPLESGLTPNRLGQPTIELVTVTSSVLSLSHQQRAQLTTVYNTALAGAVELDSPRGIQLQKEAERDLQRMTPLIKPSSSTSSEDEQSDHMHPYEGQLQLHMLAQLGAQYQVDREDAREQARQAICSKRWAWVHAGLADTIALVALGITIYTLAAC